MIWAIVSSWSCFCWLYRASPFLAAKNIINLILVLTIWWCPCIESSLVWLEVGICYDQCFLAGSQCEESHPWQGHEEGSLTKRKDVIRLQGFPLEFPEHPPLKKIRICLLFHSSDILWKKSNQGFSLLHLKGMFQLNPSDSSLACLTGSPDLLQPPNRKRHKA